MEFRKREGKKGSIAGWSLSSKQELVNAFKVADDLQDRTMVES